MGHNVEGGGTDLTFTVMNHHDWRWFNHHLPVLRVEDSRGILAWSGGEAVAACVYDNWTQNSVQCHLLILRPIFLRHGLMERFCEAGFGEHRRYVYGLVPGDNKKALRLNKHMGFTEVARLPEGFKPGVDYVIMQWKREDCRFL